MEKTLTQSTPKKRPFNAKTVATFSDFQDGLLNWRLWTTLAWQDIKLRYRRSTLGPFWLTISMFVIIYALGLIYGSLFKTDLRKYFPHIATGMIFWNFISVTIMEMVDTFVENGHTIKQTKLPYTVYSLRIYTRNCIILAHHLIALIPILIYFKMAVNIPLALISFLLVSICIFSYGTLLGFLGARFRDIKPIIQNVLQLIFYVTPIMWMAEQLPEKYTFIATWNPMHHILDILRAPFIYTSIPSLSFLAASFIACVGFLLMCLIFIKSRHRIPFWI